METAKKRGIVIYDLDINGDTEEIFEMHSLLKEYAEGFKSFVKDRNPKLAKNVTFEQIKSGVPMAERRGLSGEVKDIVFRGVRDRPNSKIKIPMWTSKDQERLSPGVHKKLQMLRNKIVHRGSLDPDRFHKVLQFEADFLMDQYRSNKTPLTYSEDAMLLLDRMVDGTAGRRKEG